MSRVLPKPGPEGEPIFFLGFAATFLNEIIRIEFCSIYKSTRFAENQTFPRLIHVTQIVNICEIEAFTINARNEYNFSL